MARSSKLVAANGIGGGSDELEDAAAAGSGSSFHSAKVGALYKESLEAAALGLDPKGEYDFFGDAAALPLLIGGGALAPTMDASMAGRSGMGVAGMGSIGGGGGSFTTGAGSAIAEGLPGAYKESLPAATGFRPNGE